MIDLHEAEDAVMDQKTGFQLTYMRQKMYSAGRILSDLHEAKDASADRILADLHEAEDALTDRILPDLHEA